MSDTLQLECAESAIPKVITGCSSDSEQEEHKTNSRKSMSALNSFMSDLMDEYSTSPSMNIIVSDNARVLPKSSSQSLKNLPSAFASKTSLTALLRKEMSRWENYPIQPESIVGSNPSQPKRRESYLMEDDDMLVMISGLASSSSSPTIPHRRSSIIYDYQQPQSKENTTSLLSVSTDPGYVKNTAPKVPRRRVSIADSEQCLKSSVVRIHPWPSESASIISQNWIDMASGKRRNTDEDYYDFNPSIHDGCRKKWTPVKEAPIVETFPKFPIRQTSLDEI